MQPHPKLRSKAHRTRKNPPHLERHLRKRSAIRVIDRWRRFTSSIMLNCVCWLEKWWASCILPAFEPRNGRTYKSSLIDSTNFCSTGRRISVHPLTAALHPPIPKSNRAASLCGSSSTAHAPSSIVPVSVALMNESSANPAPPNEGTEILPTIASSLLAPYSISSSTNPTPSSYGAVPPGG